MSYRRKIDDLLRLGHKSASELERLLRVAGAQEAWTDALRAVLPDDLAPHCRVDRLAGESMVVVTDHANWATRARFVVPTVLVNLQQLPEFRRVEQVTVRVAQSANAPEQPNEPPAPKLEGRAARQRAIETIRNLLNDES
ncbi:MAG: DUF721 domain-containing protein [Pseudomonadaceae bacterium]|nr:DUF721 domain-containing protein [Pseudomonadaceae bacterium]